MSIEKTELKIAFLHDRGVKADDAKEAMEREFQQTIGAIAVLKLVQNNLSNILRSASEELHASQDLSPAQLTKVLRYLQRCVDSVVSTSTSAGVEKIRIEGKIILLTDQIKILKKELDTEQEKLELQKNPPPVDENSRRPPARIPGVHPGESLKTRRTREAENPVTLTDLMATAPTLPPEAPLSEETAETEISNGAVRKPRHKRIRVPS